MMSAVEDMDKLDKQHKICVLPASTGASTGAFSQSE
jgi:hypothetical protein